MEKALPTLVVTFMALNLERTKLAIRHIPPAYSEDEFRELVAEWIEKADYFAFFPGKVVKDAYGKILRRDNPTYGCAHINFTRPKDLLRFFREFNGKTLTDSCGFKAKLLIDFALLQQVSDSNWAKPNPDSGTFQSSLMYQQFLQKHPEFAPKEAAPVEEIDLDNPDLAALASTLRSAAENEMEKVIDSGVNPDLNPIVPKFAEIVQAEEKKLAHVETPLTAFISKRLRKGPKDRESERGGREKPKEKERENAKNTSQSSSNQQPKKFESRSRNEKPEVKRPVYQPPNQESKNETSSNNQIPVQREPVQPELTYQPLPQAQVPSQAQGEAQRPSQAQSQPTQPSRPVKQFATKAAQSQPAQSAQQSQQTQNAPKEKAHKSQKSKPQPSQPQQQAHSSRQTAPPKTQKVKPKPSKPISESQAQAQMQAAVPEPVVTSPVTPAKAPKILARKPKPEPVSQEQPTITPAPSVPSQASAPLNQPVALKPQKKQAPKKDSIKAMLNAEQPKPADTNPSVKAESTTQAPIKRVFTTSARKQQSQ